MTKTWQSVASKQILRAMKAKKKGTWVSLDVDECPVCAYMEKQGIVIKDGDCGIWEPDPICPACPSCEEYAMIISKKTGETAVPLLRNLRRKLKS